MLQASQKYSDNRIILINLVKRHCSNEILDSIEKATFREQKTSKQ